MSVCLRVLNDCAGGEHLWPECSSAHTRISARKYYCDTFFEAFQSRFRSFQACCSAAQRATYETNKSPSIDYLEPFPFTESITIYNSEDGLFNSTGHRSLYISGADCVNWTGYEGQASPHVDRISFK